MDADLAECPRQRCYISAILTGTGFESGIPGEVIRQIKLVDVRKVCYVY